MKHLKTYKIFESNNSRDILLNYFISNLKVNDINVKIFDGLPGEMGLLKNGKNIGSVRITTYDDWVNMEMIDLSPEFQRQGNGMIIYQALFDAAIKMGYSGLVSLAFDHSGTGQQRSPAATELLGKLIKKHGGRILDVSDHVEQDYIDTYSGQDGFYGPPYEDFYIDGSSIVKREKV